MLLDLIHSLDLTVVTSNFSYLKRMQAYDAIFQVIDVV
jgi:hypothetical protein